jgi:hypothetical protein
MLIHECSGMLLTVRDTPLFPAEAPGVIPVADVPKSACLTIQGEIEDLSPLARPFGSPSATCNLRPLAISRREQRPPAGARARRLARYR